MKYSVKKVVRFPLIAWKWYVSQYKGKWYQRIVASIASVVIFFFLYLGAVDINLFGLFGKSPTMECIDNPITNEASLVYSSDSVLIER